MNIGIIGTGAFGIALASVLVKNNNNVTMWSKFEEEIISLKNSRKSPNLGNYSIPQSIKFTNILEEAVSNSDLIVLVVPAKFINDTSKMLKTYLRSYQHICIASKGFDNNSGKSLYNIVMENLNTDNIGIISGPSFAIDIVNNAPIGVTLASKNDKTIEIIKKSFENNFFKISSTSDVTGVGICGIVKNIMAIGSGIISGMQLPISTNSLLITTALKDIRTIIKALDGSEETLLELAGIGDIILTCTSPKSRNFSFGVLIGENDNKEVIHKYVQNNTVEGLDGLSNINKIVDNLDIYTPFLKLMYEIIFENKTKNDLIMFLTQKK